MSVANLFLTKFVSIHVFGSWDAVPVAFCSKLSVAFALMSCCLVKETSI